MLVDGRIIEVEKLRNLEIVLVHKVVHIVLAGMGRRRKCAVEI